MNLLQGWSETRANGMAINADPVLGGIVDQNIASGKWFVVFNHADIESVEGFDSRDAAFEAFYAALNDHVSAQMAGYGGSAGIAQYAIPDILHRLHDSQGEASSVKLSVDGIMAVTESPLRDQLRYALDAGITADQLSSAIWGDGQSWSAVCESYGRGQESLVTAWEEEGFELSSTGGGFWALFKNVAGFTFMVTDYAESATPNPDFPLFVAPYSSEGECLGDSMRAVNLADASSKAESWVNEQGHRYDVGARPAGPSGPRL